MSHRSRTLATATTRPPEAEETGRDLGAEVLTVHTWLRTHPAVSPNSISLEAGLSRNSLANLLREHEPENPTPQRLDKLYVAMRRYGFQPQGPGLPVALAAGAVEQLLHLAGRGCALVQNGPALWVVLQFEATAPGQPGRIIDTLGSGPTPTLALSIAMAAVNNLTA